MITKIVLKRRNRVKQKHGALTEFYLEASHETLDTRGLGGTWRGSYNYADLHRVMDHWVGISVFKLKPIFVLESLEDLANYLEEEHGVILEKDYT